jgi:hypothetical protein
LFFIVFTSKIKIGCGTKKMPQPFFCDQFTPITRRSEENYFVGLLTYALRKSAIVSAFPENSSDWLSPKKRPWAHTAAVPFGIYTRLSCSAAQVRRLSCHKAAYEVKSIIARRILSVKSQKLPLSLQFSLTDSPYYAIMIN